LLPLAIETAITYNQIAKETIMERFEILQSLTSLIKEKMSVKGDIGELQRFAEDLGADSLDLMDFVMAVENRFSIRVPDEDLVKLKTVGDAVSYVQEKLPK
jgi:acyl carrier protein